MGKNICLKYSHKLFDQDKQESVTDALKSSSKRVVKKTAEATDDFIGNKIGSKNKNPKNFITE